MTKIDKQVLIGIVAVLILGALAYKEGNLPGQGTSFPTVQGVK